MALPQTNEGFLSPDINVQSDFGLGEQSALLTQEDIKPSQPYQVTTVQETIPAAPPVSVRTSYDPFASDLEGIISPFTDPEEIRERRKKEEERRKQIKPVGEADPLFETEPTLNVGTPEVPQLKVDTPEPTLQMMRRPGQDLTARVQQYGREVPEESIKDPFDIDFTAAFQQSLKSPEGVVRTAKLGFDVTKGLGTAYEAFKDDLFGTAAQQQFLKTLPSESARISAEGLMKSANTDPTLLFKGVDKLGLVDEAKTVSTAFNKLYDPAKEALYEAWYGVEKGNVGLGTAFGRIKTDISKGFSESSVGKFYQSQTGQNIMKGAGAALSAYGAYNAFKQGDTLGGVANTVSTIATFVPGLQPVAVALQAVSFVSSLTGWGRGKPKPGMGGSEIMYDKKTGQLAHSMTWSYNGFNPSQAKQHTDQTVNFVNGYMKKFNMKLDSEKASQLGQYHTRIDVSPYKNGSQSAGEMIERWMSSGAFVGTPSYFDAEAGERRFFTSQEQYEREVNRFANTQFS